MDFSNIGIYFASDDAEIWAEFLKEKLDEETEYHSTLEDLTQNCEKSHFVNVVLAAPEFLEIEIPERLWSMKPEQSIMVLLGVEETELKFSFLKQKFKQIFEWNVFTAEETSESVSLLLSTINTLHETSRRTSESSVNYDYLPAPRPSIPELRHVNPNEFVSLPKLQIATVENEETVEVFIFTTRKGSDQIEICFSHMPEEVDTTAVFDDKALYQLHIKDTTVLNTESAFIARDGPEKIGTGIIPEFPAMKFDQSIPITPSKTDIIRDILGNENDPAPIVCQLLGLIDSSGTETQLELLDNELSTKYKALKKEKPEDCKLFLIEGDVHHKWPSLLHYAAEYNFQKLGKELLDHPYSIQACYTMNSQKAIPQTIAEKNGNTDFYRMVRSFLKVESLKGNIPHELYEGLPTIKESRTEEQAVTKKEKHTSKFLKNIKTKLKKRHKTLAAGVTLEEEIPQRGRSKSIPMLFEHNQERRPSASSVSSSERVESGYFDFCKTEETAENHLDSPNDQLTFAHTLPHKTITKF